MTQRLCNHHQTRDKQDASPTTNTEYYADETSEMMARILSISKIKQESREEPSNTKQDEEDEDSDVFYWSEDEYLVLKAFYENENPHEQEEQDEKMIEQYLLDICQNQHQRQHQQQQEPHPQQQQ